MLSEVAVRTRINTLFSPGKFDTACAMSSAVFAVIMAVILAGAGAMTAGATPALAQEETLYEEITVITKSGVETTTVAVGEAPKRSGQAADLAMFITFFLLTGAGVTYVVYRSEL